jgi:hypothetical protein
MLLLIKSSPFVSKMVPERPVASTLSPSAASASPARRDPVPPSSRLVTTIVAAGAWQKGRKNASSNRQGIPGRAGKDEDTNEDVLLSRGFICNA